MLRHQKYLVYVCLTMTHDFAAGGDRTKTGTFASPTLSLLPQFNNNSGNTIINIDPSVVGKNLRPTTRPENDLRSLTGSTAVDGAVSHTRAKGVAEKIDDSLPPQTSSTRRMSQHRRRSRSYHRHQHIVPPWSWFPVFCLPFMILFMSIPFVNVVAGIKYEKKCPVDPAIAYFLQASGMVGIVAVVRYIFEVVKPIGWGRKSSGEWLYVAAVVLFTVAGWKVYGAYKRQQFSQKHAPTYCDQLFYTYGFIMIMSTLWFSIVFVSIAYFFPTRDPFRFWRRILRELRRKRNAANWEGQGHRSRFNSLSTAASSSRAQYFWGVFQSGVTGKDSGQVSEKKTNSPHLRMSKSGPERKVRGLSLDKTGGKAHFESDPLGEHSGMSSKAMDKLAQRKRYGPKSNDTVIEGLEA